VQLRKYDGQLGLCRFDQQHQKRGPSSPPARPPSVNVTNHCEEHSKPALVTASSAGVHAAAFIGTSSSPRCDHVPSAPCGHGDPCESRTTFTTTRRITAAGPLTASVSGVRQQSRERDKQSGGGGPMEECEGGEPETAVVANVQLMACRVVGGADELASRTGTASTRLGACDFLCD
jgi:hypothetical protein